MQPQFSSASSIFSSKVGTTALKSTNVNNLMVKMIVYITCLYNVSPWPSPWFLESCISSSFPSLPVPVSRWCLLCSHTYCRHFKSVTACTLKKDIFTCTTCLFINCSYSSSHIIKAKLFHPFLLVFCRFNALFTGYENNTHQYFSFLDDALLHPVYLLIRCWGEHVAF